MLIDGNTVLDFLKKYNILVKGVLHIGAHECEEKSFYNNTLQVSDDRILWIDGNRKKVDEMIHRGFNNVYHAIIDETEREVIFNITDNSQASSILTLNHGAGFYNTIHITEQLHGTTETLVHFLKTHKKDAKDYNFWNLDIQGTELYALRGAKDILQYCDAIYTEVNKDYVYTNCGLITDIDELLAEHGFSRVHVLWTDVQWGDALYLKVKV